MAIPKIEADPLLNSRMKRHIKHLGLTNTDEYRKWCSSHNFKPSLVKNLDQIDRELKAKKTESQRDRINQDLRRHLRKMGFADISAYREWCRSQNLNDSLQKSPQQRKKEIETKRRADFNSSEGAISGSRGDLRQVIDGIEAGSIAEDHIANPALSRVYTFMHGDDGEDNRKRSFARLLRAAIPKADFLDLNPVIEHAGKTDGNTLVGALYAISGHADSWIRAPEAWQPTHKALRKRFSELVRHLFTLYPVPSFMESAWFTGVDTSALEQQRWYIHLGSGGNIRTAGLPMSYTKKMAHLFLQAPDSYTIIEALRYGQVLALGGAIDLVGHINTTPLGERLEHEEFWSTVIHFFVNNPMLDLDYVGPIIDYINHRKFEPEDGIDNGGPRDPGFSMKGRKPEPLLELVDEWHQLLAREQKKRSTSGQWASSDIPPYELLEEDKDSGHLLRWTIAEILTHKELMDEGRAMKHCVRSYESSCVKGMKSVWSLCREDTETKSKTRVLTIAVKNDVRKVVQARGKCNAMPGMRPGSRQEALIARRDEALLTRGRRVMKMWGDENDISVPYFT